jgi:hypothetical protein
VRGNSEKGKKMKKSLLVPLFFLIVGHIASASELTNESIIEGFLKAEGVAASNVVVNFPKNPVVLANMAIWPLFVDYQLTRSTPAATDTKEKRDALKRMKIREVLYTVDGRQYDCLAMFGIGSSSVTEVVAGVGLSECTIDGFKTEESLTGTISTKSNGITLIKE